MLRTNDLKCAKWCRYDQILSSYKPKSRVTPFLRVKRN